MLRAALYARFSTDQQSAASTADQLRICREHAERLGGVVVGEFEDAGISGAAMANRPGLQGLLRFVKARGCDVVIAEHTDRFSRGGGDSWGIFYELEAHGVRYVTVNQGEISKMHIGLSGTMSELMIEEMAKKTRRGLEGVVLSGRSAGGIAYGYRSPLAYDAAGERIRGLREIEPHEAEVVRGIFRYFASGDSPLAIADALNRQGTAAPRGGHWLASTIMGSKQRGLGILRNELYRGVRVWGRLSTVKNRVSGKRRSAPGNGSVQRIETPELRIVEEGLWRAVQARLESVSVGPCGEGRGQRRPRHLLSGLIRCGRCGGIMTSAGSGGYLRCSGRSNRGNTFCSNTRNPAYDRIEARVLGGIEANLLHPAAVEASLQAFRQTLADDRRTQASQRSPMERELADVTRRAERLIGEVEAGMPWAVVKDRHAQLVARQTVLSAALERAPEGADVVRLHTGSADAYRAFVGSLRSGLGGDDARDARNAVRGLVEQVRFLPLERRGAFELDISADLAPILAANDGRSTRASDGNGVMFRALARVPVRFLVAG